MESNNSLSTSELFFLSSLLRSLSAFQRRLEANDFTQAESNGLRNLAHTFELTFNVTYSSQGQSTISDLKLLIELQGYLNALLSRFEAKGVTQDDENFNVGNQSNGNFVHEAKNHSNLHHSNCNVVHEARNHSNQMAMLKDVQDL